MNLPSRTALKEHFRDWRLNDRDLVWLWLSLRDRASDAFPVEAYGANDMCDRMADFIEDERMRGDLAEARAVTMLPDHDLQWIGKSGRQVNWLLREFLEYLRENQLPAPACPAHLSPRDELIALLDYWRDPIAQKQRLLDRLQRKWNRHLADDKHYAWFKRGDEKQKCEVAWDWYQQEYPRLVREASKFAKLDDILFCLDTSNLKLDEKRFHLEEIKRELKRRQSRNNLEGKSQTNLALSGEIRSQLNMLAAKQGLTLVAVVERLIQHANRYGMPKEPSDTEPAGPVSRS